MSKYYNVRKLVFVIACMMAIVQQTAAQEYSPPASDFARLYVGAVEPQYESWLWHDVPYYKDDTRMYDGRISYQLSWGGL